MARIFASCASSETPRSACLSVETRTYPIARMLDSMALRRGGSKRYAPAAFTGFTHDRFSINVRTGPNKLWGVPGGGGSFAMVGPLLNFLPGRSTPSIGFETPRAVWFHLVAQDVEIAIVAAHFKVRVGGAVPLVEQFLYE